MTEKKGPKIRDGRASPGTDGARLGAAHGEGAAHGAESDVADSPVKLRRKFKHKLEFIANHYRVAMYALVEQQMGDFIDREYKKLLQEELKKIEADE